MVTKLISYSPYLVALVIFFFVYRMIIRRRGVYTNTSLGLFNSSDLADWPDVKYFLPGEFDSKDRDGSGVGTGVNMRASFITALDALRSELREPMRINSGYRTLKHNEFVRGSSRSSHLSGLAADVHCPDRAYQKRLSELAAQNGFVRIGHYITMNGGRFLHIDNDVSKAYQGPWYIVRGKQVTKSQFDLSI